MNDDRFVSYAQNLEDVMLWRALAADIRDTKGEAGFYIDVGASDPSLLSVTRAFYERGWRGVNVEPLPEQAAALRKARPRDIVVEAAVAAEPGRRPFYRVVSGTQTGLSTFDEAGARLHEADGARVETIEVAVTTLAEICREHAAGPVHFLKIDAEGAETEVLAGADFTTCRPWIIVIEATHPLDAAPAAIPWEAGLIAAGYTPVWFDGLNRFYLADEHARLRTHFQVQPNVFDRYAVHDGPLWDHIAGTEALAAVRQEEIQSLEAELARLNSPGLHDFTAPAGPVAPQPLPPPAPPSEDAPPVRRSLAKRLVLLAYRLVRPVVRPIAWRTRQFLVGDLKTELDGHRIRLDQLIARPVMAQSGHDKALLAAMERLLLTLALEDGRRPGPPELWTTPPDGDRRREPLSMHDPGR